MHAAQMANELSQRERALRRLPLPVSEAQLAAVLPPVRGPARARTVLGYQLGAAARRALGLLPGLRERLDVPRLQPLRSSSLAMYRFWKLPYGVAEKPQSLADVPWEYVRANWDKIPFLGLREYWYPALQTRQLKNNSVVPVTLAGDNLVFFRDGDGVARALENRCPHRSALLSLGQVGVFRPGTLTCRYHGMTFDGAGTCVAYLTEPNSPACGKICARAYPVQEIAGIIWVYMGDNTPDPVEQAVPHAARVLTQKNFLVFREVFPYNYLNQLDAATDLAHVGVLHRNCGMFADQKGWGDIDGKTLPGGGVQGYFTEPDQHPGPLHLDKLTFYLPGLVYWAVNWPFSPYMYFWFVPRDIGSWEGWLMLDGPSGHLSGGVVRALMRAFISTPLGRNTPGVDCMHGGDVPMQMGQGRVVRWDTDQLTRNDRAVSKTRRLLQQAHARELADRSQRGQPPRPAPPQEPATPMVEP
jgi:nitrite reductase/ring-hydroxylating ferredoxin subunit